jgi:PAS domain S-box-containing protein
MNRQVMADPLLSAIVDSSTDAIVARDVEGVVTTWNDAAAGLFGYPAEDILGRSVEILIPPEQIDAQRAIFARVLDGKRVRNYETQRLHRSGRRLDVSLTLSPIHGDSGTVIGVAGIEHDISAHKRVEHERTKLIADLERSNADLEQFAYVASHDLSEPLRAIAGMVDLLARRYEHDLDETAHDYIRRAVAGTQRMQALITDLLMYSRAGRIELNLEPVDTAALVSTTVESLGPAVGDTGGKIESEDLPTLTADAGKLRQVFQNLVANALKFHGDSPPCVRVAAIPTDAGWEFTVSDNGIGIEERHRKRIFMIFQRLHGRDAFEGTGIGLALCKRLIEAHGGRIWVGPEGPPGTTFHFTIPQPEATA